MSGEPRPVVRIPSIFDSDDDSEEETTHSSMTFRALTTTSTTTTINTTSTTKPINESQQKPPSPPSTGTKEPQSLSSNSDSDGEPFSPKPEEAKPVKPVSSPHVQSSSEDSENSEDEGGGKNLVFSKERKLEDEEEEEDEDATLVADQSDNINISHSSPENQDGSDDEDEDDSSNSDDDDEDDSDDEQDRSGSSVEYESMTLSQEGGSHVVYSPATPLSIKITTIKKGGFAIRQETPSFKPPFQVQGARDKEKHTPEQHEKNFPTAKEKEILKEHEDKKMNEEKMELEEMKKEEKEAKATLEHELEEIKDIKDIDICRKSSPMHEKVTEKSENQEKVNGEEAEMDNSNENSSTKTIEEEKNALSEQKRENMEREEREEEKIETMESNEEETVLKETAKHTTSNQSEKSKPVETAVKEYETSITSNRSEAIKNKDESDGSDSETLAIESPLSAETEASKGIKDEVSKDKDEPMEVEGEKDLIGKEGVRESHVGEVRKTLEVRDEKEEKEKEEEEEEMEIEEKEEEREHTDRKEDKKEEEGKETTYKTTYRNEEEEKEEKEEEEVEVAKIDPKMTYRKEEKVNEEKEGEEGEVQETTFRREVKEEEEVQKSSTIFRREEEKEEKESKIQETTFRGEEKEEEEEEDGKEETTFRKEEEEKVIQPQIDNQTIFTRVEKNKEEKEEEKEIQKTQVITQTTFRKEEKKTKEDKEKHDESVIESDKTNTLTNTKMQEENKDRNYNTEDRLEIIDVEDVEMKERKEEEKEEEEEGKRGRDRDSSRARDKSPPPPAIPPPVTVVLNSDSDSETTMDAEKARDIISKSSAKRTKVPLKVEDVYLDSEDDSRSLSKPPGEGGSEGGAAGVDIGRLSTVTSETDSVDPEDQRDCLSQHSSSRASSTDLFSKVSSCSPRPDSPSDTPTRSRHSARPRKPFDITPTELARYMEAFKAGWRREIVMRAVQNPTKAGGARADIYYYAPSGKKLRSRVEIEDYLYRVGITDLTLDNFTWVKQPLGVSEQYEVIRHASAKSASSSITPRRKPTPGTPTSTGSTSPATSIQHSSALPHSTSHTPKATPVVTITTYTKTPPMVRIPASVKAVSGIKSPIVSSAPSTTKASVSASSVASAVSKSSPGVVYSYDTTTPRKRGRGRPRKYSQEEPQPPPKRARMKTTPVVPVSLKKGAGRGDITSPLPPPLPPPPPPPPPTSIPAPLPTSPAMQHLQHHTPPPQGMSMGVQRPILPTPTPRPRQPARKTKDPVVTTGHITSLPPGPPKILTPMLVGGARQRTFHCTGTCPLGGGSVPCLQCVKCLCLFHPECTCMPPQIVTIIQAGAAKFLCPNCYRENKENVSSNKWVLPEPFEPLAHDPSSASSDTDSEDESTGGRQSEKEVWVENYTQVCLRPDTPPTPPSSPSPSHSLGPWRGDRSDSRQDQIGEQAQQSGQSGEMSRGVAAMACLPPHSMGSQLVQIQQPGSATPCFFLVQGRPGAPGGELVPMPGTSMGMGKGMQPVILPRFMDHQQQVQMSGPLMMQQQLFRSAMPLQMQQQDLPAPHKQEAPFGKHYKQYYERESSFLGELSQRYLLLRHVFKYLSVRDLLVASQVCMLWRDLALSPSLWETVRLRNVCVTDWSEFARFLDQRNTKNLDLRKMRLKEVDITKRSSKNGGKQKLKVKGSSSITQEANTSSESLKKSPRDSLTHQDPGTKKAQGMNENQESSQRNHHPPNSADNGESSLTRKPGDINSLSRKVKEEEMEVDEDKRSDSQSSGELFMDCEEEEKDSNGNRGKGITLKSKETRAGHQEAQWQDIFGALSLVRCLRGVTLPSCPGHVLQLLLASCRHLTCINAMDLRHPSGPIRFDPAYLMETADLTELRIGSPSGFSLTTNFNFIKLQKLRVLVMRGLTGDSWPYLGTNLTTLQVGPIKTFTARTWANLGSMTNLQALWLEDGGSLFDSSVCEGLSRLTSLRRLCLFNFVVGPKLGHALKKLPHLDRLFVLPVGTEEASIVSQNGNMLAAFEVLRHVEELVWAVHASDVYFSGGCDCIRMSPNDSKMYKGMQESPDSNLWSLPKLEMVLKRQLPHSNMRIVKLDPTAASHLALATL